MSAAHTTVHVQTHIYTRTHVSCMKEEANKTLYHASVTDNTYKKHTNLLVKL